MSVVCSSVGWVDWVEWVDWVDGWMDG